MVAHTVPPYSWPDPMTQLARDLGLSRGVTDVLRILLWLPLASAGDIAGILSRPVSSVLKALGRLRKIRLEKVSLVEWSQLGCTMGQRRRWYLAAWFLEQAGLSGATWHDEAARCRLLELLPALGAAIPGPGRNVANMGELVEVPVARLPGHRRPQL